ncbi:MAG: TRAP transporter large permease [Gammaproteobacteria bacterium]|nr:TRAP transporter large permease [Gammaproteobacteria bacterium]MDP7419985.1 TRAP transporter large permease [Gammaproteobacteria bacterium]MDP7660986.1 TRAP transporter large permease [Gammaproteobacteria bacterium]HJP39896.1 TRAP transporter large permease [Gammaproteobacteria bacterium]
MIAGFGLVLMVLVLLAIRQNLLVVLGIATAYAIVVWGDGRVGNIVVDMWDAANKEILLSIPLYILAGNIMSRGAMATRLIRLMKAVSAPVPGGLAIAAILSCALFAAVSGSGTVTLIAVGAIMYPALLEAGYSKSFAIGALCAAGTLGIIVPPSIPLILYGIMTQTSIADLFIAGIGPSLVLITLLTGYALWRNRTIHAQTGSVLETWHALRDSLWALAMPVIILGGIYSGYFTATESAAVAVVYAMLIEICVYREMGFTDLYDVIGQTTRLLGSLFPVLMLALSLNIFLAYQQVPELLIGGLGEVVDSRIGFLLGMNLFLLAVGCVMDIGSAILILAPMLQPIAAAQGIDGVHLGIITVVNLEIGYLTPPLGLNLIVAMTVFREEFWTVCKAVVPFALLMLIGLQIVTFWPALSLTLVR